jgi:hypothetical protein
MYILYMYVHMSRVAKVLLFLTPTLDGFDLATHRPCRRKHYSLTTTLFGLKNYRMHTCVLGNKCSKVMFVM